EMLAKRPAFQEIDRHKLIQRVTEAAPPPLRQLDRSVPRDLATIVHKAIERDPAHRYKNAKALADDLRNFLEDRPIDARRVTTPERAYRWCRRNPAIAGLAAALVLLIGTGQLIGTWGYYQVTRAYHSESESRAALERQRNDLRWQLYVDRVWLADREY